MPLTPNVANYISQADSPAPILAKSTKMGKTLAVVEGRRQPGEYM